MPGLRRSGCMIGNDRQHQQQQSHGSFSIPTDAGPISPANPIHKSGRRITTFRTLVSTPLRICSLSVILVSLKILKLSPNCCALIKLMVNVLWKSKAVQVEYYLVPQADRRSPMFIENGKRIGQRYRRMHGSVCRGSAMRTLSSLDYMC